MKSIVFLVSSIFLFSLSVQAASPECSDVYWEKEPVLKNKLFKGALIINCKFKDDFIISVKKINEYYLDFIKNDPELVEMIQEPTAQDMGDLPGMIYKAKLFKKTSSGDMNVWLTGRLGTDLENELTYLIESDKITGKRNAKYTAKIIGMSDFEKSENGFIVTLRSETHVKQPWIAPDGIFKRKVKEGMMEGATEAFNKEISEIVEAIE